MVLSDLFGAVEREEDSSAGITDIGECWPSDKKVATLASDG